MPSVETDGLVWESPLPADLPGSVPEPARQSVSDPEQNEARSRALSLLEHRWWPLVCWVVGLMMGLGALSDNSFLTHLATGRLIRSSGAPHQDVFTFASGGRHIVVQSWLASWIYATLEDVAGAVGIRVFIALVTAVLMATLWRLTAPAGALIARVALVSMAGMVGLLWWNERPQVIAFAVLAVVALVVGEHRSSWWLVPLFALWVNVHGSFPLGVVFVGAAVAIRVIEARRLAAADVAAVGATAFGVVVGAVVSPYGFEMLTFPLHLLSRSSSLILISEWRPLGFDKVDNVIFVAESVAIAALLVWRRSWLRLLVAAFFVGLAFVAVRNVTVAALVLIPLVAPALAGLGSPDPTTPMPRRRLLAAGGIAVALAIGWLAATPNYDLSAYPSAAVDWMAAKGWVGRSDRNNVAVLSHDYSGNYLEWRYGTGANTWIDDRAELHPYRTVEDYVFLLSDIGDADRILARHPHDVVMWAAKTPLARHLADDPAYRIVYHDDMTIVACRVASSRC